MSRPTVPITSPANPLIRDVVRLRDRRHRELSGTTIVDGGREIRRAVEAGVTVVDVFVDPDRAVGHDASSALTLLARRDPPLEPTIVNGRVLDRLAFGDRNDGIVAVVRPPVRNLDTLEPPADAVIAVIEGVEKPGNLGAIVRTADAAGLTAVVAADTAADIFGPNVIRASLGAVFDLPVLAASAATTLTWLTENAFRILAARVDGAIAYTEVDLGGRVAFVLGSEARGLSETWRGEEIVAVRLPMIGRTDSLNVSTAAAVLFYEALRQRRG